MSVELRGELVRRVRALHALKAGALRMFDPMLSAVASAHGADELSEVEDLLARMHGNFGSHREVTADHVGRLASVLATFGSRPARRTSAAVGAGAALRAHTATIGGMDFGAMARDAFVFEHLEIAQAHLIEQLATRAGSDRVAAIAREIREADEAMAATINRNWTNVLSLALATRGLPVRRPAEEAA